MNFNSIVISLSSLVCIPKKLNFTNIYFYIIMVSNLLVVTYMLLIQYSASNAKFTAIITNKYREKILLFSLDYFLLLF